MPKLSDDKDTQQLISQLLLHHYERIMQPGQIADVCVRFGGYDAKLVEEAVCRHLENTQPGSDGLPAGRWPPKPADIKAQIEQVSAERLRKRQEQEQRRLREESDRHYAQACHTPAWRQELARAAAIRRALVEEFKLDYRVPRDRRVITQTLRLVQGPAGLGTVEEALETAAGPMRDREKALAADLEAQRDTALRHLQDAT